MIDTEYVGDRGKSLTAIDNQHFTLETASIALEDYGDLGRQLTLFFKDGSTLLPCLPRIRLIKRIIRTSITAADHHLSSFRRHRLAEPSQTGPAAIGRKCSLTATAAIADLSIGWQLTRMRTINWNGGGAATDWDKVGNARLAIAARAIPTMLLGLGLAACNSSSHAGGEVGMSYNPIVVADEYVRKRYPTDELPKGLDREWWVQDRGDLWMVEIGKQGTMGGGFQVAIVKKDGRVRGVIRTQ